jgi:regulation of enolase protein 1 (concanavalin A-like superfamily)
MTCGFQVFDGQPQASAVITRDTSDWSLLPLPESQDSMYFVVKRSKECVECFYSYDGFEWTQIRQAVLTEAPKLMVGMYGACPQGDGFEVVFEHVSIKSEDGELDESDGEGENLDIQDEQAELEEEEGGDDSEEQEPPEE